MYQDYIPREVARRIITSPRTEAQMLNILDATPGILPPEWISVKKSLPKENNKYLTVTIEYNNKRAIKVIGFAKDLYEIDNHDFFNRKGQSGWYSYSSEYGYTEESGIVAWQPPLNVYEGE